MSHFNQMANTWDTPEKIKLSASYAEKIKTYLPKQESLKILEFGCGTGLLGSNFIYEKNQLTGIDTSKGMLEIFEQKFSNQKNVHSILLNLEEQDINENNFDLIISAMAFHHLIDPAKMILKLKKLLSPNGIIAIIDLDQEDGSFHPDPKNMGVHHFGFSEEVTNSWAIKGNFPKHTREIINIMNKDKNNYPVFLAIFSN
ncbi:MAG: class I SAM-dependent methyltransferase [Bacteriovorax sp.]|nr:class I SAM-dependent methyltransferase [Bacteriovorax sp.]